MRLMIMFSISIAARQARAGLGVSTTNQTSPPLRASFGIFWPARSPPPLGWPRQDAVIVSVAR
jgi:hypothetical protein